VCYPFISSPLSRLRLAQHNYCQYLREHLAAIQAIIAAIGRDDMDAVAKVAARLGYSEAMGQMCEHMGAAAPGFTAMALNFHHTADSSTRSHQRDRCPAHDARR
jgi:hypothetical protein